MTDPFHLQDDSEDPESEYDDNWDIDDEEEEADLEEEEEDDWVDWEEDDAFYEEQEDEYYEDEEEDDYEDGEDVLDDEFDDE